MGATLREIAEFPLDTVPDEVQRSSWRRLQKRQARTPRPNRSKWSTSGDKCRVHHGVYTGVSENAILKNEDVTWLHLAPSLDAV